MTAAPPENAAAELQSILEKPGAHENELQGFLEVHTEFMMTPDLLNHQLNFNGVLVKFPVGDRFCDYAYLTKSSIEWRFVLVELQHANKRIFKDSSSDAAFTAHFNDAIAQIDTWNDYIKSHMREIRERLRPLLMPAGMTDNSLEVRYVLVIGRRSELERSQKRRERLSDKARRSGLTVLTYDSLLSDVQESRGYKKAVLRLNKDGYVLESVAGAPGKIFSYVSPEYLKLSKKAEADLRGHGYDIDAWKNGHMLTLNQTWARESADEVIDNSSLHPSAKAVIKNVNRKRR